MSTSRFTLRAMSWAVPPPWLISCVRSNSNWDSNLALAKRKMIERWRYFFSSLHSIIKITSVVFFDKIEMLLMKTFRCICIGIVLILEKNRPKTFKLRNKMKSVFVPRSEDFHFHLKVVLKLMKNRLERDEREWRQRCRSSSFYRAFSMAMDLWEDLAQSNRNLVFVVAMNPVEFSHLWSYLIVHSKDEMSSSRLDLTWTFVSGFFIFIVSSITRF